MSIKKWDSQTTMRFVKLYGEHRCLWDKSIPEYKCRKARDEAIMDIISKMGILNLRLEDVKCKIRIIRNAYINERKKIRNKKSFTMDGERRDYICNLNWFPIADRFLSKVVRKRVAPQEYPTGPVEVYPDGTEYHGSYVAIDNEVTQISSEHSSPRSLERIDLENLCRADIVKIESIDDLSDDPEITEAYPLPEFTQTNEPEMEEPHWRHMNSNAGDYMRDEAVGTSVSTNSSRQTYMDDGVHSMSIAEELNEFDVFAKNIALQLNRLPLENALKVQKKIHDLLLAERLTVIRQNRGRENNS